MNTPHRDPAYRTTPKAPAFVATRYARSASTASEFLVGAARTVALHSAAAENNGAAAGAVKPIFYAGADPSDHA
jgi:hypothetical protein